MSFTHLDSITKSTDMSLSKLPEIVKVREAWHAAVQWVPESDTTQWLNNSLLRATFLWANNHLPTSHGSKKAVNPWLLPWAHKPVLAMTVPCIPCGLSNNLSMRQSTCTGKEVLFPLPNLRSKDHVTLELPVVLAADQSTYWNRDKKSGNKAEKTDSQLHHLNT